jgi:flagellar motor protein MotB
MNNNLIKNILRETILTNSVFITEQELDNTLLEEGLTDVLLGIALLTGVGLSQGQAQTAEKSLSKDDVKNEIISTLKDTSELNKITKNLSPKIKDKILKNSNQALKDLKNGRVSSKIKIKGDKKLGSYLSKGYVISNIDTEYDTIPSGNDTILVYTESLDFSINSDGLFVTGEYKLSSEGVKTIQSIKDSIQKSGGQIKSVNIEAGTDKEPIKMGNKKLAELRAQSVSKYFNDVKDVNINTEFADKGPDFDSLVKKLGRENARKETSQYRFVKIIITTMFQDTITQPVEPEMEVIEKNTITLVKIIKEKNGGNFDIKIKRNKKPLINKKYKKNCDKNTKCPVFGKNKINKFLSFSHQ